MLRVALDIDGTYNRYPKYFATLAKGLQSQGAEVGILTSRNQESSRASDMRRFLEDGWRPDFYIGRQAGEKDVEPMTWKGQQMKSYKIDFLYDDFLSPVIRLFWRDDLARTSDGGAISKYGARADPDSSQAREYASR